MAEEWLLTVTDVAEALGCRQDDVLALIAQDELKLVPGKSRRISHSELRSFVVRMQTDALALGRNPLGTPSLLASQPIGILDDNNATL